MSQVTLPKVVIHLYKISLIIWLGTLGVLSVRHLVINKQKNPSGWYYETCSWRRYGRRLILLWKFYQHTAQPSYSKHIFYCLFDPILIQYLFFFFDSKLATYNWDWLCLKITNHFEDNSVAELSLISTIIWNVSE